MINPKYLAPLTATIWLIPAAAIAAEPPYPLLDVNPIDPVILMPPTATPPTTDITTEMAVEIDTYLQAHHDLRRFSGTVLVIRDGVTLFANSYGMADLAHQVPNTLDTKFRIGSITKQFTAAAILQLQDRGLLHVNAPLATYLPDYPHEAVTLHHLLTHTAGVPNMTSFPDYPQWMRQPTTLDEVIARFVDRSLEFTPGEQFSYSNSGYVLLTKVIEVVSGQPYDVYLQEWLFEPLGMENTGYEHPLAIIDDMARGYIGSDDDGYQQAQYINMAVPQGAGGLYATAGDLARWNQFLFDGDRNPMILSEDAVTAMTAPAVQMDPENLDMFYGYGLIINQSEPHRTGHGGGINGFVSSLGYRPEENQTLVILSNVATAGLDKISGDLAAILAGEPYELPTLPDVVTVDPAIYERYVGTYQLSPEFAIAITVESGQLYGQGTGQPRLALYPSSETEFFARAFELQVTFNVDEDGAVESLTLLQGGQEMVAPRNP